MTLLNCAELGGISPQTGATVAILMAKTEHDRPDVRQAAAESLGSAAPRGDPEVLARLRAMNETDADILVQEAALLSLACLARQGSSDGEHAVTRLLSHTSEAETTATLRADEWDRRWLAAEALASHFDSAAGADCFCEDPTDTWEATRAKSVRALQTAVNDKCPEV